MSFTGTATIYLLDGGLNGMEWLFAALWQLGIVTVDLSIGWMSARTHVSSFTITLTKVFTSPKLSLYLTMALFLLCVDWYSVLCTI